MSDELFPEDETPEESRDVSIDQLRKDQLVLGRRSDAYLKERRQKVWTLRQSGMTVDDIIKVLNATPEGVSLTKDDIVTKDMILNDLVRLEEDFITRAREFNEKLEIGQQIAQFENLYEQTMLQYFEAPTGSAQKAKFLDLARQLLDSKSKFLQSVGLVDKVADKKLIKHQSDIVDQFSPAQKQQLEQQLIQMALQQTGGHAYNPPLLEGEIVDIDPEQKN